ncbi:hypothetical protein BT63DRAFT_421794 [Microthyrium microscopicum]|uniref:VWFA domain-containing protein n=1 Tax=Microthyrium microscopicum TaxID=703497 RepID=A0A6A6UPG1_9PEZI|nr:hypothetical protein BT63DRAFT_421794 [Microthyrium microscopicum]
MPFVLAPSPHPSLNSINSNMSSGFFSSLSKKISRRHSKASSAASASSSKTNSWSTATGSPTSPTQSSSFPVVNRSQHLAPPNAQGAPPAYSAVASDVPATARESEDNRFSFLAKFDTIFVIDDSTSMLGSNWNQTREALAAITPVCTAHDSDGVDIYFLNTPDQKAFHNIQLPSTVHEVFSMVTPRGATPTGQRLHVILKEYLEKFKKHGENIKPLNIIVITDGEATDDVDSPLIAAAKKLDKLEAPAWQVGIQFFQVGQSPLAREYLKYLDDNLCDRNGKEIRDMVDTVPWTGQTGTTLNADGILKVVLGAVNRRLDKSGVALHQMH